MLIRKLKAFYDQKHAIMKLRGGKMQDKTQQDKTQLPDAWIEAMIEQNAAIAKIADDYDVPEEVKEITRQCLKGEITWGEGYEKIRNLPIHVK